MAACIQKAGSRCTVDLTRNAIAQRRVERAGDRVRVVWLKREAPKHV